jgi:hypothetical protein
VRSDENGLAGRKAGGPVVAALVPAIHPVIYFFSMQ